MLEWLRQLDEEQREAAIRESFRQVLDTEPGKVVFATILEHLHVFRPIQDEESKALNNYGIFLLDLLGQDAELRAIEAIIKLPKET